MESLVSILVTALVGFLESRRAGLPGPPREHLSTALQLISEWWPTVLASEGPAVFVRTAVLASNFVLVLSWQPSHSLPRQGEQWSTVSVLTLPKKLWSTAHIAEVNCGPLPTLPEKLRTAKFWSKTVRHSPAPLPKTVEHCAIQNWGHPPKKQSLEYLQGAPSLDCSVAATPRFGATEK